ncbi:hypothetical protein KLP28_12475 [Nocardioidaceae bacterium]|nr:hypothetical protein KLP28_12475 [Nocardioidaceae bacterium]
MSSTGEGMARWKNLVMDTAIDETTLGSFWAAALGDGVLSDNMVDGAPDVQVPPGEVTPLGIRMLPIGEHPATRNHVHLDIFTDSVESLLELGASPHESGEMPEGLPWTVMRDPEGGEFCAFVREPAPRYRLHAVVVDSTDPERAARWWGEVFGVEPLDHEDHWTLAGVHPVEQVTIDFVKVPELAAAKGRLRFDVYGDVDALLAHGATEARAESGTHVLADPDGHHFGVHLESH